MSDRAALLPLHAAILTGLGPWLLVTRMSEARKSSPGTLGVLSIPPSGSTQRSMPAAPPTFLDGESPPNNLANVLLKRLGLA
jgi:hypothetical protein